MSLLSHVTSQFSIKKEYIGIYLLNILLKYHTFRLNSVVFTSDNLRVEVKTQN